MKKIICIGSATRDIFVEIKESKVIENRNDLTAQRLMAFEFGAKMYAKNFRENVGGSAINVGAGLANCEFRTFVFARTSRKGAGKWILKEASKLGLKKNYMQQNGGEQSEISVIISDLKNKDHIIFRTGDSVAKFDVEKAIKRFREKVHWIYIGSQKGGWQEDFLKIAEFAKSKKAKIAINPSSFQIEDDSKKLVDFFGSAETVFLNRDEAIEIVQKVKGEVKDDIKFLFENLLEFGEKTSVITDGENGAYVANEKDEIFHIPIVSGKINDTVGAGDAFASGFLASYIENEGDIKKSLIWGISNSGSVVGKKGATNGLLKKGEMRRREEELKKTITKV